MLADMHLIYGLAEGNARTAERLYRKRYPQRDVPDHRMFANLHHKLCTYGSLRGNRHNELQIEEYFSGIHVGTHMDAPCHFVKGRWSVDQIPISHLIAPAAVIDITKKAGEDRDALVQVDDFENWEITTGQSLDGTIVMIRSGWGKRWNDREAFIGTADNDTTKLHYPGISEEAAQWLVDNRNVYGVGSETLSLDNGPSQELMAHRIILDKNVFGLENVANMDMLPIYGATLYVLPMKIGNGSGAPTRIIATFPKILHGKDGKAVTERTLREIIIFNK
ncbi:isatin hydrolase [Trichonephila clavipes]|nr:isatin hydrolase [Trichonephila clavipes]